VFNNPSAQGSCLWNQNVDNCVFLDYLDTPSDGVLPLATPNRAPVIQAFNVAPTDLGLLETATATATIQDPEADDYTLAWTAKCYDSAATDESIIPATDSNPPKGPTFTATFTAPSAIANPIVWCEVKLTATDEHGNTSSATRNLIVSRPGEGCVLEGTVYGTGGLPLTNTTLTLEGWTDCSQSPNKQVTTDANGHYRIEDVPCCQVCNGYISNFYGNLSFDFQRDSTSWTANQSVSLSCPLVQEVRQTAAAIIGPGGGNCQNDIYLPTVWGKLQGTFFGSDLSTTGPSVLFQITPLYQDYSQIVVLNTQVQGTSTDGATASYGPVAVPVGEASMFSPTLDIWFGDYSIPQRNQTVIQDVGGRGTVSGTAYYDNGATAAGVEVKIYDSYPRGTTTTDAEGFYSFANVPTGRVNVEAQVHGAGPVYYTSSGGYLTQNDGTVTVNINSPARCNLEGTLYDYTGQPLQEGWVNLSTYNSYYDSGVSTNVNGLYSFTAIQPDLPFVELYSLDL
jgi:hypothetical protein